MYADRVEAQGKKSIKEHPNEYSSADSGNRSPISGKRQREDDDKGEPNLLGYNGVQVSDCRVGVNGFCSNLQSKSIELTAQDRHERFTASKELIQARMREGTSVLEHGLKMIGLIVKLKNLGVVMDNVLYLDLILLSLPSSFNSFVMNFNMLNMDVSVYKLVNMLSSAEAFLKKDKPSMLSSTSRSKAKKSKKGRKGKGSCSRKQPLRSSDWVEKKKGKSQEDKCFHCNKTGHWKRNCQEYLKSIKEGLFFDEVNPSSNCTS